MMEAWIAAALLVVSILGVVIFVRSQTMTKTMKTIGIVACSLSALLLCGYLLLTLMLAVRVH